jgi:hypothetical protein
MTTIPFEPGEADPNRSRFTGDTRDEHVHRVLTEAEAQELGELLDRRAGLTAGGSMATQEVDVAVGAAWSGAIAFEGVDTGDGRIITAGALNWRELPIPLMAQTTSAHGFGDPGPAAIAGRIETLDRAGEEIVGAGIFDTSEAGIEAERLVREGMLTGISIDLAVNEAEIIPPEDPADEIEAMFGGTLNVLDGTILGATLVPFPAFENARIAIVAGAAMTLRHARREDGRMVVSVTLPFAPFPVGPAGGGDDEADPQDANSDAAEAIADITDAVNGWPGMDGQVVVTIDGKDTTIKFPPAKPDGSEPGEDGASISPEVLAALSALRTALRREAS